MFWKDSRKQNHLVSEWLIEKFILMKMYLVLNSLYSRVSQVTFDMAYGKKDCLQLPNLNSFSHFMIWELCLALVPYLHSWAGRGLWAEGQVVNISVEFLSVHLKTPSDVLSCAVFYSLHSTTSVCLSWQSFLLFTSSSLQTQNNPLLSLVSTARGCWSMFWDITPLFWLSKTRVK